MSVWMTIIIIIIIVFNRLLLVRLFNFLFALGVISGDISCVKEVCVCCMYIIICMYYVHALAFINLCTYETTALICCGLNIGVRVHYREKHYN